MLLGVAVCSVVVLCCSVIMLLGVSVAEVEAAVCCVMFAVFVWIGLCVCCVFVGNPVVKWGVAVGVMGM